MRDRIGLGITNCQPARKVVEAVQLAERLGAEIAFVSEDVNCRDAFELCALSATVTEHIALATGVVNPYTRNPTSLAMATATLDEISAGRAVLGLGTSSPSLIQEQMGVQVGKSALVMSEATHIVRGLLSGNVVSFAGERFNYVNAHLEVKPVQSRVPIYFAAMGPLTLRLAGEIADGVLLNVGATTDYIRWAVGEIRQGAVGADRDPSTITIAAWLTAYVTDDHDAGLQKSREWLATMLSIPRQGELLLNHGGFDASCLPGIREHISAYPYQGDRQAASAYVPVEYAEHMTLIGDPGRVRERIDEYRDAGVQIPVLGISVLRALYRESADQT